MSEPSSPSDKQREMSFIEHLLELRNRLLKIVLTVMLLLLVLMPFANELFTLLAKPLLQHLPASSQMIATQVASPVLIPLKLALVVAIFLSIPVILYHAWAFVAPGLYKHEKNLVFPLLMTGTLLFFTGILFAYYIVFPVMFGILISMAPEGVTVMTDIAHYLDFVLKLFFAFGLVFQVPLITVMLVRVGVLTTANLIEKRPYVIVGAFILGMLLTPGPDVISQTMLAMPIWLLFEVGVICSRFILVKKESDDNST